MQKFHQNDKLILKSIIILVVSYAWIAFLLTLLGVFYVQILWISWFLLNTFFTLKKIIKFPKPSKTFSVLIIISLISGIFIASQSNPTVFTGRDQGSIAQAAKELAIHHTSHFHLLESDAFFEHYGTGKALNFPGFHYDADGALTTQFPLPYISFLAGFVGVFGSKGIFLANAFLFVLFFLSIVSVAKISLPSSKYGLWIFLILLISSAPILYFTLFSLSENLASALVFSTILLFLFYFLEKNYKTLVLLLLTLGILTFTRIEGFWFLLVSLFILFRDKNLIKEVIIKHTFVTALLISFFISILIATFVTNFSFYKTLFAVALHKLDFSAKTPKDYNKYNFLVDVLFKFNLLIPLILSALYICYISLKRGIIKYKAFALFFVFPIFIYYIKPNITLDAPWMLRRYDFAVLPITILYSSALIILWSKSKFKYLSFTTFIVLVIFNLSVAKPLLFEKNHDNLLKQTHSLAQKFSENDLVLLSANVTGDGFSMLPGPLRTEYNLHATYFFNPNDWDKIKKDKFSHVFLIVSQKELPFYKDLIKNLKPIDTFKIKTSFIPPQKTFPISLKSKDIEILNYIYKLK